MESVPKIFYSSLLSGAAEPEKKRRGGSPQPFITYFALFCLFKTTTTARTTKKYGQASVV